MRVHFFNGGGPSASGETSGTRRQPMHKEQVFFVPIQPAVVLQTQRTTSKTVRCAVFRKGEKFQFHFDSLLLKLLPTDDECRTRRGPVCEKMLISPEGIEISFALTGTTSSGWLSLAMGGRRSFLSLGLMKINDMRIFAHFTVAVVLVVAWGKGFPANFASGSKCSKSVINSPPPGR